MSPSLLDTFAASMIEGALRAGLAGDPATRAELAALAPARLRLVLERPPMTLTLAFDEDATRVEADDEIPAEATVYATAPALVDVVAGDPQRAVLSGGLRIEGDGDLAQSAFRVLARLQPDLEAPLRRIVGEAPAAAFGAAAGRGRGFARRVAEDSLALSRSWLTSADGPLPSRVEVARFLDEVDEARLAADRLEARVRRLRAAAAPPGEPTGAQDAGRTDDLS